MLARRLAALLFAVAIAIVLPSIALAAVNPTGSQQVYHQGLVPCGVSSDPTTATECEACNLVQLVQNVITFLIGLAVPIAMCMFAWAGVLYFTSASNTENISKAKNIFKSTAFGFALALASWIIVNTILYTVLDTTQYPNSTWFHVECTKFTRDRTNDIGEVINKYLPDVPFIQADMNNTSYTAFTPVYSCDESKGFYMIDQSGTKVCVNDKGQKVSPTITQTFAGSGALCPPSNLACSPAEIMRLAGVSQARANAMSCIAITESSGDPTAQSKISTACGTWQILNSNWNNSSLHSGGCSSSVSCQSAECNLQAAIALGNARKNGGGSYYGDWTCPGCNNKAAACVAKYDPGN